MKELLKKFEECCKIIKETEINLINKINSKMPREIKIDHIEEDGDAIVAVRIAWGKYIKYEVSELIDLLEEKGSIGIQDLENLKNTRYDFY